MSLRMRFPAAEAGRSKEELEGALLRGSRAGRASAAKLKDPLATGSHPRQAQTKFRARDTGNRGQGGNGSRCNLNRVVLEGMESTRGQVERRLVETRSERGASKGWPRPAQTDRALPT